MTVGPARDCTFDELGRWFRYRAAAVILHEGAVLMIRNERDKYAYSVGGAVGHGESAEQAVRREVREETGVTMEVERLLFVHENFFTDEDNPDYAGKVCHEVAMYFLMRYDGSPIAGGSMSSDGALEHPVWVPLADYGREFPAYPAFFATELLDPPAAPKLVVSRDEAR